MNYGLNSCAREKGICNDHFRPYLELVKVLLVEETKVWRSNPC